MSGVIVNYNNNQLTSMSSSGTKTLLTSGKYCEGNFEVVYSEPTTSSLTVTPTETAQTFNATGVYGYKPVTVNAISSTYVGTGIANKSSTDTTFAGTAGTFIAPAGYYSAAATRTITTQAAQIIYPSTATQYVNSYRWLTGSQTIASVTTTNLSAENIAEGVVVKVGDSSNASRITQVTGTHKGGGGHDAVLLNDGIYNERVPMYNYVKYNDTRYYTNEDTFNFNEGDTISTLMYGVGNSNVYLNNTLIGSGINVSFSAPSYPLAVYFSADGIYFNKAYPSGTLSITSNGTYNVYGYSSASVNITNPSTSSLTVTPTSTTQTFNATGVYGYKPVTVNGDSNLIPENIADGVSIFGVSGTHAGGIGENKYNCTVYGTGNSYRTYVQTVNGTYYSEGLFEFSSGGILSIYANGTQGGGTIILNDVIVSSTTYNQAYYSITLPPCDIEATFYYGADASVIVSTPIISISNNGRYDVGNYASADIKINGGGFTTDDIAMRTIFGDISGSATRIGNYAFDSCSALTTVSFPNATTIGNYAFRNCSSLTTVSFPNATTISASAFLYCSALTTASFPNVKTIGSYAFRDCYSLTTASFPNATSISYYAFGNCYSLTTVSFPSVTTIGSYAFSGCYSLTTVSFPNATTISASAFLYCSALTTASFPNVKTIGSSAFLSCYNLLSFYLLGSSIPTLLKSNTFGSTPINGYTTSTGGVYGSIFVPSSLYDQYIVATNWSLYSSRIVSV